MKARRITNTSRADVFGGGEGFRKVGWEVKKLQLYLHQHLTEIQLMIQY